LIRCSVSAVLEEAPSISGGDHVERLAHPSIEASLLLASALYEGCDEGKPATKKKNPLTPRGEGQQFSSRLVAGEVGYGPVWRRKSIKRRYRQTHSPDGRLEPGLVKEEAREVLAETVEHLLRDVGKVDPPFPRI
jgi:hypothetical protein